MINENSMTSLISYRVALIVGTFLIAILLCGTQGTASAEQVQSIETGGCTTGSTVNSTCSFNINWPAAFLNTNYIAVCNPVTISSMNQVSAGSYSLEVVFSSHTTTTTEVVLRNLATGVPVTLYNATCIGVLP